MNIYVFVVLLCSLVITNTIAVSHAGTDLFDSATCKDKVSMCYTYDPIICVVYRSWAEVQCACFCQFHGHYGTPTPIPLAGSTVTSSHHVTTAVLKSITCFTCEDYFIFRCQSFATECADTCMIRYKDGKLESKCTMDLECRNAQQTDFLNSGVSTRCCRTSHCVSQTLQEAVKAHHAPIGSQTTSIVAMSSLQTTQHPSSQSKTTVAKTSPSANRTTYVSSAVMTTDPTLNRTAQSTSEVSPNGFGNTKASSSPLTTTGTVTKPWSFVTIPVGRRRRFFKIKKYIIKDSLFNLYGH